MKTVIRKTLACSALMLAGVLAIGQAAAQHNGPLLAAIHGDHRSDLNKARDVYRSPYDTLTFFGIEPHHTVIEAWPGGGWYTEILAPYLKENGKLIAATYDRSDNPEQGWMTGSNAAFARLIDSNTELYGDIEISQQLTQSQSAIAPAGTVDAIVDFRNAHNWLGMGADNVVMAWHAALKPGGVVGIVDHRWPADQAAIPGNGYIHEQQLIDLMTAHGFTLAGRSEINANPNDPKDHPNGVWMLPPNLRGLDDETRARNIRIGESDRMTLKFIKN
ncbi:MAG: methyltransferase [Gammaproteobacteria bacterium]|nr:methyltransferase [Gammaproteobacteria bacterium]MBJ55994.1 methyltransferase [Gammaproteobacteria bacterium]HBN14334.1 methyltransferase [Pseudohongiella sp.]